jgi:hypothetical protein
MKKQKEMNKIRKKIQDIQGEFNKDMESLKKKKDHVEILHIKSSVS